jgi:hypothetical protein
LLLLLLLSWFSHFHFTVQTHSAQTHYHAHAHTWNPEVYKYSTLISRRTDLFLELIVFATIWLKTSGLAKARLLRWIRDCLQGMGSAFNGIWPSCHEIASGLVNNILNPGDRDTSHVPSRIGFNKICLYEVIKLTYVFTDSNRNTLLFHDSYALCSTPLIDQVP